ncbi:unnamed protein product [Periconia digitata]|uniref:Uncharacterized protein n=1 Tax=Periconia digitata TaxID=1303443 RepID=A0A9W4UMJ5_9PLEO|nr:unnamed protein product [Periconia digitata]
MRSAITIWLLCAAVVLAQQTPSPTRCQCPLVKCDGSDAAKLCQCRNSRETLCKQTCPDYVPTYLPCPTGSPTLRSSTSTQVPVPTPTSSSTPGECECEERFCAMMWPQSCYCANANKQACYDKCGGVKPALADCPPIDPPSLSTLTTTSRKPTTTTTKKTSSTTSTRKPTTTPRPTHAPCGGNSPTAPTCEAGYICIKDPYKPGCGPACDQQGICVEDRMCGGFAGFECRMKGQVCWDDPRDDCAAEDGGNDCAGVCVWPHQLG